MGLKEFDKRLEKDKLANFLLKHKKLINIIQGLFIIGLLIGIQIYMVKDYTIKKQIADHCGYETNKYECICEQKYVNEYKQYLETGEINITDYGELAR